MNRVYLYLNNGKYSCYADISDEVELPPYSTLTMPPETMTNPYWINGQWINKKQASDKAPNYQEVLATLPSPEQQMIAALALDVAQMKAVK